LGTLRLGQVCRHCGIVTRRRRLSACATRKWSESQER